MARTRYGVLGLLWMATTVIAFGVGHRHGQGERKEMLSALGALTMRVDGLASRGSTTADALARTSDARFLREVVLEAMAQPACTEVRATTEAAAAPPTEPDRKAPPTPANLEASEQGHRVLEAAVRAGTWTDNDVASLRAVLPSLTAAQQDELLAELIPAINGGELRVDTMGPPF